MPRNTIKLREYLNKIYFGSVPQNNAEVAENTPHLITNDHLFRKCNMCKSYMWPLRTKQLDHKCIYRRNRYHKLPFQRGQNKQGRDSTMTEETKNSKKCHMLPFRNKKFNSN